MSDPFVPRPTRRTFLAAAAAVTTLSLPVLQASAARRKKPTTTGVPTDAGPVTAYAKDGVTDTWAKSDASFFVVRRDGKVFALSSICTHRFCPVVAKPDEFYCKCHRSHFTLEGQVTGGPAPTSLPRYGVSVDADGHLVVDPSKEFSEAHWDDAGSFVKV